ncbi:hypothetical protein [Marivita sp. GX14005]|uniref:hypothetical protein n=1 Tax=Marivita sp. GX14005 TaxID=2942276 RepID=UPI002018FB02|nr:hypothetical protein [Marivita sp. GX14005]MCL3882377.1 hypothetical protein [Marivita sp. GX14005]
MSSNKILTVSYGTFSCTLEGFDRSFDTMKAIAEYFRDLAQDDRYFGAEPPTPDAEMLARIAEREIERRVEARFEKGNLVLRPTEDAEAPHGDVAPDKPTEDDAAMTEAPASVPVVAEAPVADMAGDTSQDDEEDIAASDPAADTLAEFDEPDAPDLDEVIAEQPEAETGETERVLDETHNVREDEGELASADDTPSYEDAAIEWDAEDDEETSLAPSTESVADKLQRIRAVVASRAQDDPEYIEDEHASATAQEPSADEAASVDEPLEEEEEWDENADNLFADTIAALVNDRIEEDEDEREIAQGSEPESASEAENDALSEIEALRARIAELEAQAAASEDAAEEEPELSQDAAVEREPDEMADAEPVEHDAPAAEARAEDDPPAIVARVGKAKRSDVEAALASGVIEEYDEAAGADPVPDSDDSTLSPEQEAELKRELAELQAEIEEDEDWNFGDTDGSETADHARIDDEAEANIRKAVKMTSPGRAMLTDSAIEADDPSVDRLIDQTETEMDEPEGNRRRSAIAHLRAAVAATKADRLLGRGKKDADEEEPYREDLADAVRPRRPSLTQARSERPAPVRPAPLKLVAEQRVDVEAEPDAAPVRPRRVIRAEDTAPLAADMSDDSGFAEFAEQAGAHTLPELLEAAAAYMSFVEGRDQFSRPQLMTKLHQAEGEASSREERLRSFGQLLRDGKIEKKGGGRFAASDNIGFKPSSRAAG